MLQTLRTPIIAILGATAMTLAGCGSSGELPPPSKGPYTLDASHSRLSFISTKNGAVSEVHGFKVLSGSIDRDGAASVSLDLASVDTQIPIRDERMQEHLFEVAAFPSAEITAQIDPKALRALPTGESRQMTVNAQIVLHGSTQPVSLPVIVTRAGPDALIVASEQPVVVQASQFGLLDGIAKLREIAGLTSISPAVPVSVLLRFEAQ